MVFIVIMSIACILANMFQCLPVQSNWETSLWETRKCIDRQYLQYAGAALSVATDIAILVMPIKYLLALPVAKRYKIQVVVLMTLGALACICSIIRFKYIYVVANSKDPTWDGFWLSFWTSLEYNLGLITSSVPAIKPLYVKYVGSKFTSLRGNNSSCMDSQESKPSEASMATEVSMPHIAWFGLYIKNFLTWLSNISKMDKVGCIKRWTLGVCMDGVWSLDFLLFVRLHVYTPIADFFWNHISFLAI